MPLYEFDCSACGSRIELMLSIKARTPRRCPECGATGALKKAVSAPAFQFKGTGWYVTDYADKKSSPSKDDSSSSSSESKSSESSDSAESSSSKSESKSKSSSKKSSSKSDK